MLKCILAGAVLMDLALRDRIDTDLEHLFIIDETPTGVTSLDTTLSILAGSKNEDRRSAKSWIEQIASGS
jgi:golgi phosphoprotein 3